MAPPRETLRFSENKINRFPPDQSFTDSCLKNSTKCLNCCKMYSYILYIIQLSSEGEVLTVADIYLDASRLSIPLQSWTKLLRKLYT